MKAAHTRRATVGYPRVCCCVHGDEVEKCSVRLIVHAGDRISLFHVSIGVGIHVPTLVHPHGQCARRRAEFMDYRQRKMYTKEEKEMSQSFFFSIGFFSQAATGAGW